MRKFFLVLFVFCFANINSNSQQITFGGQITVVSPNSNPITYVPTATKFSGDYLVHTSDFTGIADGGIFTASLWFKLSDAAQDGTLRRVCQFSGIGGGLAGTCRITIDTVNKLTVTAENSSLTTILVIKSTSSYTASSTWHHMITSIDMSDSAKQHLYIDGGNERNTSTFTVGGIIDFANGGNFGIMARGTDGAGIVTGSLSEVWFTTSYLDVSIASNLQLFRSTIGHPVNLGSIGDTPTGSQPRLYLKNSFATFQNNLGSGGNFSVTGSLEDDPSTP